MHTLARLSLGCLAAALLLPAVAAAQTNVYGYELTPATYGYVAPPSGSAQGLADDDVASFTLPWAFPWFGVNQTALYASDNGAISFAATTFIDFGNSCLPASFVDVDLAVFWDDLEAGAGLPFPGDVHIWRDTTGSNDRVIVSWEALPAYGATIPLGATFQAQLYPTGEVQYHWDTTNFFDASLDDGASATIGMQNAAGATSTGAALDPIEVSCFLASTLETTAISFATCTDGDGDGFADDACGGQDCDDADALISPDALDICANGLDEDCSGADDPIDADGDGYTNDACVGGDDCNDGNANINPSVDADGDGSDVCADCNDSPGIGAFLYPGNTEVCGDGIDQDCSGGDDAADGDGDLYVNVACGGDDCDDGDAAVNPGSDLDSDGFSVCDGDCDDNEPAAAPGGVEVCDGGVDNDCDGNTDDVDADGDLDLAIACGGSDCDDSDPTVGATTDDDGDGADACDDCDDDDDAIYPGALEICDAVDTDCDGLDDAFDLDIGGQTNVAQAAGPGPAVTFQPTNANVTSVLAVSGAGFVVSDLNLTLNITFDPTADVTITLTSPSGTPVVLASGVGEIFFSANFNNTEFDDEAPGSINNGSAPFAGSYIPQGALSAFDGEPVAGNWTLGINTPAFGFGFSPGQLTTWSLELVVAQVDDADGDGAVDACGDCDPTDALIYPDAPETCGDAIDQDCDGADDTGDEDGDSYIDANCGGDDCDDNDFTLNPGVDDDLDGSDACADCDDGNLNNFPGNLEICGDGLDQDCSGADDAGDADSDGYVNDGCVGGDDCDDNNALVFPGAFDQDGDGFDVCADCYDLGGDNEPLVNPDAIETCDGLDNDCDGTFDNQDADADGFVNEECTGGTDCDDSDPLVNPQSDGDGDGFHACVDCDDGNLAIYPGNAEICDDTIDQNCNGSDLVGDGDGDGFNSEGICGGDDCDDDNAGANPDAVDACDGVDLDCDGTTTSVDEDGDGFFDEACGGDDCDDTLVAVRPNATEVCDGVDNNCDGALLDGGEDDLDGDGLAVCAEDCDDTDPNLFPGATELCDGVDNDCDGEVDDGVVRDGDEDGAERRSCGGDDCDDGDALVNPDEREDCTDGIDNDCDELFDGDDNDCDFANGGCASCRSTVGGEGPAGGLSLLLLAAFARRRRTA